MEIIVMKKFFYSLGMVFSAWLLFSSTSVDAAEIVEGESLQNEITEPEDGVNDPSTVDLQVRRVLDKPIPELYYLGDEAPPTASSLVSASSLMPMGAGEWDFLGTSTFKLSSREFLSGGGDLLIFITQPYTGPSGVWHYRLLEVDPVINDTIASFKNANVPGLYEVKFNVRSFVDGDNGKAEVKLQKLNYATTSVTTEWYD